MSFWSVTFALMEGLVNTGKLFFLTLLFALPLGLLICFGSMNRWAPFSFLARRQNASPRLRKLSRFAPIGFLVKLVVWIVRGSPLMLQILIVYYGPGLLFDLPLLPRFTAALVTFVINYACYFSEIYRGGIQSIPKGQQEAGLVLGMTKTQIFFKVTLLQLIKRIVPPMGNEFITLVKDTALVRVIAVYEIIWVGESFVKKGMMWPLFYTAVFYLILNGILTLLLSLFEKKLSYFK
jgi:polar amino acid transport system permease protein